MKIPSLPPAHFYKGGVNYTLDPVTEVKGGWEGFEIYFLSNFP